MTPQELHYFTLLQLYSDSIQSYRQHVQNLLTLEVDVDMVLALLSTIPRKRFDRMYYSMYPHRPLVEDQYNLHYRNVSILSMSPKLSDSILQHVLSMSWYPGLFYDHLQAFLFLEYPIQVSSSLVTNRFLSMTIEFQRLEETILAIVSTKKWILFGNLWEYMNLSRTSLWILERCWDIKSSHLLFEYKTPTMGQLHILPNALQCLGTEYSETNRPQPNLSCEYTFGHREYYPPTSVNVATTSSCTYVDQIVRHATTHRIGHTIGSFYQTAGPNVVLVAPTVTGLGHVLSSREQIQVDTQVGISIVSLSPSVNILDILLNTIRILPNTQEPRPSYIIVPDHEIPFWTNSLSTLQQESIYLMSFTDAATTLLPNTHVLLIDEAHSLVDLILFPEKCRHIICLSSRPLEHHPFLMKLCGIDNLPFPPLNPIQDTLVVHDTTQAPNPRIWYITPSLEVSRTQEQIEFSHVSENRLSTLLRQCAGLSRSSSSSYEKLTMSTEVPYTDEKDPCMICLSEILSKPVMLPCKHVLCYKCNCRLLRSSSPPQCPTCRAHIKRENLRRPPWTRLKTSTILPARTKQLHMGAFVVDYLSRRKENDMLCIVTPYSEVAEIYRNLLAEHSEDLSLSIRVIHPSGYTRHVHEYTTEILVTDIDCNQIAWTNILFSTRQITILLSKGCSDEFLFHQWKSGSKSNKIST
jgi:hypothetical protein